MKLEVGESLFVSWLKHVKECEVVQLNWKPSMKAWKFENADELEELKEYAKKYFQEKYNLNLFGKSDELSQIVKQAELDALGIQLTAGELQEVYAIDVAFHEGGLNYRGIDNTIAKITQKIIRAVICLRGYFGVKKGTIVFASPKVNKGIIEKIAPVLDEIKRILTDLEYDFCIEFIANERFENEVLQPVIKASSDVADTSELFMRSIKLLKMFHQLENDVSNPSVVEESIFEPHFVPDLNVEVEEIKVGKFAQLSFGRLFEEDLLSNEDISLLTQRDYSKQVFDVNYPILKEINPNESVTMQLKIDGNGINRYYVNTYSKNEKVYALTSQWFERSKNKLESWVAEKMNNISENEVSELVATINQDLAIGKFARTAFDELFEKALLDEDNIQRLTQERYSKDTFDLNYPLLKEIDPSIELVPQIQKNNKGPYRYYVNLYQFNNKHYALTSQWFESSRIKLKNWLETKGFKFD